MTIIPTNAAKLMYAIAEAVMTVDATNTYDGFYVSEVRIGFQNEDTGYRVLPDEFEGYGLAAVKSEPKP